MKLMKSRKIVAKGFTLVELLTTLAVVAVLIGLLVPALSMVQKTAMNVKQKGQFHAIETGLEAFRSEMGDYPPSYAPYPANNTDPEIYDYFGAERLAEAMVGLDGFGFHPKSLFRNDGLADMDNDGAINDPVYDAADPANLQARKGPYLELETANAVRLDAYGNWYNSIIHANVTPYILADVFKIRKHEQTGKQIGMPILYYKADTTNFWHTHENAHLRTASLPPNVYKQTDNFQFYETPGVGDHPLTVEPDGYQWFYNKTANPNFPADPATDPDLRLRRPYRAESFILQSAGHDGLYGTEDDVFNFDEHQK